MIRIIIDSVTIVILGILGHFRKHAIVPVVELESNHCCKQVVYGVQL